MKGERHEDIVDTCKAGDIARRARLAAAELRALGAHHTADYFIDMTREESLRDRIEELEDNVRSLAKTAGLQTETLRSMMESIKKVAGNGF